MYSKFFYDIVKTSVENANVPDDAEVIDKTELRQSALLKFNTIAKFQIEKAALLGKMFVVVSIEDIKCKEVQEFCKICKENGFSVDYKWDISKRYTDFTISWINGVKDYQEYVTACKHLNDEMCTNDASPYCADYCPVVDNQDICKFAESANANKCNNFERCKDCPDYSMNEKCLCSRR